MATSTQLDRLHLHCLELVGKNCLTRPSTATVHNTREDLGILFADIECRDIGSGAFVTRSAVAIDRRGRLEVLTITRDVDEDRIGRGANGQLLDRPAAPAPA